MDGLEGGDERLKINIERVGVLSLTSVIVIYERILENRTACSYFMWSKWIG
jgi:hypothetical protein